MSPTLKSLQDKKDIGRDQGRLRIQIKLYLLDGKQA